MDSAAFAEATVTVSRDACWLTHRWTWIENATYIRAFEADRTTVLRANDLYTVTYRRTEAASAIWSASWCTNTSTTSATGSLGGTRRKSEK